MHKFYLTNYDHTGHSESYDVNETKKSWRSLLCVESIDSVKRLCRQISDEQFQVLSETINKVGFDAMDSVSPVTMEEMKYILEHDVDDVSALIEKRNADKRRKEEYKIAEKKYSEFLEDRKWERYFLATEIFKPEMFSDSDTELSGDVIFHLMSDFKIKHYHVSNVASCYQDFISFMKSYLSNVKELSEVDGSFMEEVECVKNILEKANQNTVSVLLMYGTIWMCAMYGTIDGDKDYPDECVPYIKELKEKQYDEDDDYDYEYYDEHVFRYEKYVEPIGEYCIDTYVRTDYRYYND